MSRFIEWYVSESLRNMGWPRPKGFFRKQLSVDTKLLDVVVEQAVQIAVGLGAGRPRFGLAVIADTFADNPWTEESTAALLLGLKEGELDIQRNPELPPWKALYAKYRVSGYGNDVNWQELGDAAFVSVRAMASARGIFWGLTHESQMPEVFDKARQDYERTASFALPAGLDVPVKFPWDSLEHFYANCEDLEILQKQSRILSRAGVQSL